MKIAALNQAFPRFGAAYQVNVHLKDKDGNAITDTRRQDDVAAVVRVNIVAAKPDSQVHIVEGGKMLQVFCPDEKVHEMERFLDRFSEDDPPLILGAVTSVTYQPINRLDTRI